MMTQSVQAEFDQASEIEKDEELLSPGRSGEVASNQYIQDLYRFFKLHPQRAEFEDIFNWSFDFHNKRGFHKILREDRKLLRNIAEYNFAKNYFNEAVDIYLFLLEEKDDGELFQKTAFCYQKLGDYKIALDYYLKAELFDLNKAWNYKKIALCFRNLKQHKKALEYYKQAELLDPENLNIHVSIGHCYLDLNEYEEALKCYFKVEYLSPGNKKVWRPIGWCSLLVGKSEQALKYYNKLIEEQPNKYDLMNMGHVQWCLGKRIEALDYYKRSIKDAENSEREFMEAFMEDEQHLIEQGVDGDDIPIMLDQLRYSLEE
jgi:tetratricopeptide (TPR) repeat protein